MKKNFQHQTGFIELRRDGKRYYARFTIRFVDERPAYIAGIKGVWLWVKGSSITECKERVIPFFRRRLAAFGVHEPGIIAEELPGMSRN